MFLSFSEYLNFIINVKYVGRFFSNSEYLNFITKRCSLTELKVIETVVSMKWSSINQILILLFVCAA